MTTRSNWLGAFTVVALLAASRLSGQTTTSSTIDTVPVVSGARVRVSAPALGPRPGVFRFAAIRGDTLLLRPANGTAVDTTRVALAGVTQIEASRGWRQRALVAAGIGAAIGAVVGGIGGHQLDEEARTPCDGCSPNSRGLSAFIWGATGAAYTAGAGVLIARFVIGERWQVVALR